MSSEYNRGFGDAVSVYSKGNSRFKIVMDELKKAESENIELKAYGSKLIAELAEARKSLDKFVERCDALVDEREELREGFREEEKRIERIVAKQKDTIIGYEKTLREGALDGQATMEEAYETIRGLREALKEDIELFELIASGRKASTGGMHNTYTPQLDRKRIDAALERARAELAPQPDQETPRKLHPNTTTHYKDGFRATPCQCQRCKDIRAGNCQCQECKDIKEDEVVVKNVIRLMERYPYGLAHELFMRVANAYWELKKRHDTGSEDLKAETRCIRCKGPRQDTLGNFCNDCRKNLFGQSEIHKDQETSVPPDLKNLSPGGGIPPRPLEPRAQESSRRPEPDECGNCAYFTMDDGGVEWGNCLQGDEPSRTIRRGWCEAWKGQQISQDTESSGEKP